MLRSFCCRRLLHLLACLAVALMLVAPLLSRWSQAQAVEPMCMRVPALDAGISLHADHLSMPPQNAVHQHVIVDTTAQHAGDHDAAMHGAPCDYCVLAAWLLPWLAWMVLSLLQCRPSPVPVHAKARTWSALRWAALGARGPPLHA